MLGIIVGVTFTDVTHFFGRGATPSCGSFMFALGQLYREEAMALPPPPDVCLSLTSTGSCASSYCKPGWKDRQTNGQTDRH